MEQFAAYGHAIVSLAGISLLILLLSPVSAMRKTSTGLAPGAQPEADYANATYRWHRCYANLTETVGVFAAVTVAAILAGASPFWVNLLASVFVLVRIALAFIHIRGIGKPNMSVRSYTYVIGWLICILLAVMAIYEVFKGG